MILFLLFQLFVVQIMAIYIQYSILRLRNQYEGCLDCESFVYRIVTGRKM